MNREYFTWFSPALQKDMELLVFGHGGASVILFPTRTAHFYDYENWRIIGAIKEKIEQGFLQVFCVDSIDIESFYSTSHPSEKIKRHLEYEHYIISEVLPLVWHKSNTTYVTLGGCSLGGYHAMNIALKYPQLFNKVVGMSARYDLTLSSQLFPDLFDGFIDENIYYNMPSMYVPNLDDATILEHIRKLNISFVSGIEDPFFANNQQLSSALAGKNIPHNFHVWEGESHRPRYWREMVKLYL
jgi:esterase/lipase superfamily enzyme